MNKSEKIKTLKKWIEICKSHREDTKDEETQDTLDFQVEMYERELKLLSTPKRTIGTLEVGDVIITRLKGNEWTQISMQEQSQINHFIAFSHCYDIDTVIPHEFLSLWEEFFEVITNE